MELKALKAEFKRPTSDARSSSQTHQARVILRKAPAAVRRRIPGFRRPVSMKGFGDELLDYITAGPKLRKWYGQDNWIPSDGGSLPDIDDGRTSAANGGEEETEPGTRDAVLVTQGESPTGEQVVLQLVLARASVKALVNDAAAARAAFGPYVTPVSAQIDDEEALCKALKGVRAVVIPGRLGKLLPAARRCKIEHLVLLSTVGGNEGFSFGSLLDSDARVLKDPARESAVMSSNIPYTIVRCSRIQDVPGGGSGLRFMQGSAPVDGSISREDLAKVLTGALAKTPEQGLAFSVTAGGQAPLPSDWNGVLSLMQEVSA